MNNATRRTLIERKKQSGFPGSIIDVFKAYDQGVDLIGQFQQQQQMQVANTPQQQQEGLRPQHQAGNTNASMAFPNTPPDASFNTVGMKAPINLKQYDPRGNLVKSYEAVPPGVTDLKMSSQGGTVIETPAQMQFGGAKPGPRVPEMSDAEMSLKIIQEANAGNPAARRMRSDYGQRMFLPGETNPSTHYMASFDNYAVPTVQEDYIGGPLSYNPNPAPSKADFRFDTPEQANYFAENYKNASAAKTFQQKNGGVRKYQTGDALAFGIDSELLKAGIAGTESSGGVNMMNPGSTATGLYGQLFSEIRGSYPRTRKEFSTNIAAQDSIFDKRLYEGLNNERSLMDNVQHMYETYPEQIAEKGYNAEQVAGIINMLGRQGTREYLGYVVRDGKDLGEVFPNLYGDNVKVKNKTPDQYAETMQDWMDRYAEDNCPGGVCEQVTERKTGGNAFERFSNALKSRKKDAPKQSNIFRSYTIEKPKEESSSGKRLDRKSWASLSAKMSYKTGGVTKYQQGGPRKLVEVNGELVSVGLNATKKEMQKAYEQQYVSKPESAPQPEPSKYFNRKLKRK